MKQDVPTMSDYKKPDLESLEKRILLLEAKIHEIEATLKLLTEMHNYRVPVPL